MTASPRIRCARASEIANLGLPDGAVVWCGEASNWTSPYGEGADAVALFRDHLAETDSRKSEWMRANLFRLRGRKLACSCGLDQACHVDVLAEAANGEAGKLRNHPFADLLPMLQGKAKDEFQDDIRVHGVRTPIKIYNGLLLDGRNRLEAAEATGRLLTFEDFVGDDAAALAYVISENVRGRRHLNESQRAMFAAALAALGVGTNQHKAKARKDGEALIAAPTQEQAAQLLDVSRRSVQHAAVVRDKGSESLRAAVERGDVAVSSAAVIAGAMDKPEQDKLVIRGERDVLRHAADIRVDRAEIKRTARRLQRLEQGFQGGTVDDLRRLIDAGFKARAILADCAWHFQTFSGRGEGKSAIQHYDVQDLEAIKALPIRNLAADDCALFLWMLDWCPKWALEVIEAWGFEHKTTAFTWIKLIEGHDGVPRQGGVISDNDFHFGPGHWTRANPEDNWLATRGNPKRFDAGVRQLIVAPVMEHSRKPDVHERIERLVDGPYLELNARRARPGWVCWGDELEFVMPTIGAVQPVREEEPGEPAPPLPRAEWHRRMQEMTNVDFSKPSGAQRSAADLATPQGDQDTSIPTFLRRQQPGDEWPDMPPEIRRQGGGDDK